MRKLRTGKALLTHGHITNKVEMRLELCLSLFLFLSLFPFMISLRFLSLPSTPYVSQASLELVIH